MTRRISVLCYLIPLLIVFGSCGKHHIKGEGGIVSEGRSARNITSIDVSAPVIANIRIAPGKPSIRLTGYKSLLEHIKTKFEGNTLNVYSSDLIRFDTDSDVVVEITINSLEELVLHGASEANVLGALEGADFRTRISGAGSASIENVRTDKLNAAISGAGSMKILAGVVNKGSFVVSGSGSIEAYGLQVNDAIAKISGAGEIELTALKTLSAHASGAGNIHYKGKPVLESNTSGAGDIERVD